MPFTTFDRRPVGRFAPTPSGALHFGSLVAAFGSFLDAKSLGGDWLLRIDDLDPRRNKAGATDKILRTLESFGFEWTGSVEYQSEHLELYEEAFRKLIDSQRVYRCACTRKIVGEVGRVGPDGPIYSGTCRYAGNSDVLGQSLRINTTGVKVEFMDRIHGRVSCELDSYLGDFVVRRSDRVFSYTLATTVDDDVLGITDVVRGADLIPSALRQVFLCEEIGVSLPRFCHLPKVVDESGRKLSKSSEDRGIDSFNPAEVLCDALEVMGQTPPRSLRGESVLAVREWGIVSWDIKRIPSGPVVAKPCYLP